jgi:hypothetical protein
MPKRQIAIATVLSLAYYLLLVMKSSDPVTAADLLPVAAIVAVVFALDWAVRRLLPRKEKAR